MAPVNAFAACYATQPVHFAMSTAHTQKPRVLVIEDNKYFAQILCDILEIKGCTPILATNAERGLELTGEMRPAMVFCDLVLPGPMSGFDYARRVRAAAACGTPALVAISGHMTPEDWDRALEAGFDKAFAKPVKFADLSRVVDNYAGMNRPDARG